MNILVTSYNSMSMLRTDCHIPKVVPYIASPQQTLHCNLSGPSILSPSAIVTAHVARDHDI